MPTYITPQTTYNGLYDFFLTDVHGMVAGCAGSGKSTAVNAILHALCCHAPCQMSYAIIDLKQISLLDWEYMPHCLRYARTPEQANETIAQFTATMDKRYADMLEQRIDKYQGGHLYLIIDEAADLLDTDKTVIKKLVHLCRLGRAANIHVIYATQSPDRKTIPAQLQQNIPCCLGLRCKSQMESRQIIGQGGCELIEGVGKGFLTTTQNPKPLFVTVPMVTQDRIEELKAWWKDPQHIKY